MIYSKGPGGGNIPPDITGCPTSDIIVTAPSGSIYAMASWTEPTSTGNQGTALTVTKTHYPGMYFEEGTTEVTYTFAYESGNTDMCKFNVIVRTDRE